MKFKLIHILLFGFALAVTGCSGTKVYLVRHAEKSTLPAGNPDLTETGKQRAQALCKAIPAKSIGAIYSTNYNRTLQTAAPIAEKAGLNIAIYVPDSATVIVRKAFDQRKSTLIVGHSNTLLPLLKNLGLNPSLEEIKDNDYDNLFIIKQRQGKLKLIEKSYGKPSPAGQVGIK